MAYGIVAKAVFQAVITMVQATSSFSTINATGNFIKSWQGVTYPVAMISPRTDTFLPKMIAYGISPQNFQFRITIKNTGTGTKANMDTLMEYVGEIVDQIEGDKNLGTISGGHNLIAKIDSVDYSLSEERRTSAIFYYAVIDITVMLQRVV